ncbi:hypothetical protein PoB_005284900 [Plakobranchus ocellatus]|uniref:Uncharacterized protein n=1 Tax=Plakobranchus ocellatus TaxID=259542 RepID=A0AAV4C1G0_9GAST|nr:hypothetical protein PoB_005284900 [Plakobranchus ocellatus]
MGAYERMHDLQIVTSFTVQFLSLNELGGMSYAPKFSINVIQLKLSTVSKVPETQPALSLRALDGSGPVGLLVYHTRQWQAEVPSDQVIGSPPNMSYHWDHTRHLNLEEKI